MAQAMWKRGGENTKNSVGKSSHGYRDGETEARRRTQLVLSASLAEQGKELSLQLLCWVSLASLHSRCGL